jgi:hypothetical protein
MSKLSLTFLFLPALISAQISFHKVHVCHAYVDRITGPYELSNGNFIASVLHGANNVWYNELYLFSECGDLVTSLVVSAPDEYVYVTEFFELDSSRVLATAYQAKSYNGWKMIHLSLDNSSLDILEERQHYETNLYDVQATLITNGEIWQAGSAGNRLLSSSMDVGLNRKNHLYRVYQRFEYPDLDYIDFAGAKDYRIYSLESYDPEDGRSYKKIRTVNTKLQDIDVLNGKTDSSTMDIRLPIGFLGGDTILVCSSDHILSAGTFPWYIRQYSGQSLLYERKVSDHFMQGSKCKYASGVLTCVGYDDEVRRIDRFGTVLQRYTSLVGQIGGGGARSTGFTKDGGVTFLAHQYILIDGQWTEVLHFRKSTNEYLIHDAPHTDCVVSTTEEAKPIQVSVYPNPSSGMIHIYSELKILQYRLYNMASELLILKQPNTFNVNIDVNLTPGMYVLEIETALGRTVQKIFIVQP